MGVGQKVLYSLHIAARTLQLLGGIVVLGLSAYVAHWYNRDTLSVSPSQVNFLIVAPLFSIISLLYLELSPKFVPRIANPYVSVFLEAVNVLFYFGGSIALTVFLNRLLFCRGMVCMAAQADTGVAWTMFVLWTTTLVTLVLDVFKLGFRQQSGAGVRSKPDMSSA